MNKQVVEEVIDEGGVVSPTVRMSRLELKINFVSEKHLQSYLDCASEKSLAWLESEVSYWLRELIAGKWKEKE